MRSRVVAVGSALGVAVAVVLSGCTVGGDDDGVAASTSSSSPPRPSSTVEPPDGPTSGGGPPAPTGPPTERPETELDAVLEAGGVTGEDVGYPVRPGAQTSYGTSAPTQDQCEVPDPTDDRRIGRVQQYWASEGWTTGEDPAVAVSVELVVYDEGGGEAALAAFVQTPTTCPTRTFEDGGVVTFTATDLPRGALADSVALRGQVAYPDGTALEQMIIAQRVGDLVGYLYVVGFDATVATDTARLTTVLATRLTALAPTVEAEVGD